MKSLVSASQSLTFWRAKAFRPGGTAPVPVQSRAVAVQSVPVTSRAGRHGCRQVVLAQRDPGGAVGFGAKIASDGAAGASTGRRGKRRG